MKCPEEFELFQLREGGLDDAREQEVATHVAGCPDCKTALAELDALGAALSAPEPLTDGARSAFVAGVVKKVDVVAPAAKPRRGLWTIAVPIAAAACCAAVALIVVPSMFLLSGRADDAVAVSSPAAAPPSGYPAEGRYNGFADSEEAPAMDQGVVARAAPPSPPAAAAARGEGGGWATTEASGAADHRGALRARVGAAPAPIGGGASMDENGFAALQEASPREPAAVDLPSAGRGGPGGSPARAPAMPAAPALGGDAFRGLGSSAGPATLTPYGSGMERAQPRPSAIDPNGRFATTYRPGRGHLWRFESALWRGRAPEAALGLVAEVGSGSGPALPPPAEGALDLHVSTELRELSPDGGPLHLAITLRSSDRAPAARPDLAVHLVMDVSGSMSGAPIEQARAAARQLVDLLEPGDHFSLTAYSSDATLIVPDGPVGSRRAGILAQIGRVHAGGGTNLEAGLRLGYDQARASREGRDSVQLVIVLSDGRANQGLTDPWALSEMSAAAFQAGCETTSIGVGDDYDPMVMSTIADYGAGGYYYLPDASAIEQVLRAELEVRSQPVARAVELRVRLADGVELIQAYGSRRLNEAEASRVRAEEIAIDQSAAHRDGIAIDRQEDREGGMRFFIPGFARDDEHTILLRLRAPGGSPGSQLHLADLELRYKDRILGRNGGDERSVSLTRAASPQAALATQDRQVRRAVLVFRTGEALAEVSSSIAAGDQPRAMAILHERSELLRAASAQLSDPSLAAEADRLVAFRDMLRGQAGESRLMLGAIVQRAASGLLR